MSETTSFCVALRQEGTCHNEFDKYLIGVIPIPLGLEGNQCTLLCLRPGFAKYEQLNNKIISVQEPHPYRRILAWRNRKCLLEHGRLCGDDVIQNALRACDLSEIANSVHNSNSDSNSGGSDDEDFVFDMESGSG